MWEVEEVAYGSLRNALNAIADHGGEIFTVIDSGVRKDFCHIVWKRVADDGELRHDVNRRAMKPVGSDA